MTTAINLVRAAEPTNRIAIGITAAFAVATLWQGSAALASSTALEKVSHLAATVILGTVTFSALGPLKRLKSGPLTGFAIETAANTLHIASGALDIVSINVAEALEVLKGRIIKPEQA